MAGAFPSDRFASSSDDWTMRVQVSGRNRRYLLRRQALAREVGACIWCGEEAEPGRTRCGACCEATRRRYHERREQGLCVRCGEPAEGWACETCKEVERARRRR